MPHLPALRLALALVICCVLIGEWHSTKLVKPSVPIKGIAISLLVKKPFPPHDCGDFRTVVLQISSADWAEINEDGPMPWAAVKSRLAEIYSRRAERDLFVIASQDVPNQYVVSDVADLDAEIPDLNSVLMTERQRLGDHSIECDYTFKPTHRRM